MINGLLWMIGLIVVLVVYFLVPLGRYTLFEHTLRIAATEPAQELGEELETAGREATDQALEQWREREQARAEANGGEDPLRLRIDPDGVLRLGEDVVGLDELRRRLHEAQQSVEHARAILEPADGAPESSVEDVQRVLREERVDVVTAEP